jgi:hypothetical protein
VRPFSAANKSCGWDQINWSWKNLHDGTRKHAKVDNYNQAISKGNTCFGEKNTSQLSKHVFTHLETKRRRLRGRRSGIWLDARTANSHTAARIRLCVCASSTLIKIDTCIGTRQETRTVRATIRRALLGGILECRQSILHGAMKE